MATPIHEVDPDGDVILTLQASTEPFAPWKDNDEDIAVEVLPAPHDEPPHSEVEQYVPSPDSENSSSQILYLLEEGTTEIAPEETPGIQFRLSSKHLILASGYFKRMFKSESQWKEHNTKNGVRTIKASECDEEAFEILMNIIHGCHENVPRTVGPELFTKMVVLADYYECFGIMNIWFSNIWIPKLQEWNPKEYGRDLVMRLCVAWLLSEDSIFKDLTRIAARQTRGPVQTLNLPIPSKIVDMIEEQRIHSLMGMINCLHDVYGIYLTGDICSDECTSIHLGALTKFMKAQHLPSAEVLQYNSDYSFLGSSVSELTSTLVMIREPQWYMNRKKQEHRCQGHFNLLIGPRVLELQAAVKGLGIEEMRHNRQEVKTSVSGKQDEEHLGH